METILKLGTICQAKILRNHIYSLSDEYVDENCAPEGFSSRPAGTGSESQNIAEEEKKLLQNKEDRTKKLTNAILIKLFPNPASTKLYLETNSMIKNGYSIVDISGRELVRNTKEIEAGSLVINLSELKLQNGIYFLNLYINQSHKQCKKFVISD